MRCPLCQCDLPAETAIEGKGSRQCTNCGATLDQYFNETESVALEKIGRFTLLKVLGEGGFGTVYHARDSHLEREVALKTIRLSKLGAVHLEARLVREAKAASKLNHPGIVKVFELVDVASMKVLVEEYVEGDTLDSLIKRKKLTQKQSVEIAIKVAEALDFAHQEKVIHRDIKPANIILDAYGQPRILDFGLAKREGLDESMTEEGQLIGTIIYMSPEQANGQIELIGQASDQYSLAICLFQMLTDELPFRGAGNVILRAIVRDDAPSLRSLKDSIPRDLENICLKALSKKISDRYSSCGAFAADLRRYLKSEPVEARPVGVVGKLERWARRNRTLAVSLATIAIILLLATGISSYFAVKSMSDLQGRISAEQRLLLEGDASEIRPVIQSFRTNLTQHEVDLRTRRSEIKNDPRKLSRVLLTLSEKEPAIEAELYPLMQKLEPPDALLVHEHLRQAPKAEFVQQLWQILGNDKLHPSKRLIAAVNLSKAAPQDERWDHAARRVVNDLLDPQSTVYLPLWLQHLKPVYTQLHSAWQVECWNQKDKQRATVATTFFLQLYGGDIHAVVRLLTALPVNNVVMVVEHLKKMQPQQQVIAELKKLTEPGAKREPLILVPSGLPPVPEALKQQIKAAGGLLQESYAICAALPWTELHPLLKQMTGFGYRPIRCRPYSTASGLKVAVIWYRDHLQATEPKWTIATDLSAADVKVQEKAALSKGWMPIELSAYEVEPQPGAKEVRYVWISIPDADRLPFRLGLSILEENYLEMNKDWLLANNAVLHRTGILDLDRRMIPVISTVTNSGDKQLALTHLIRSIPSQRGQDSFAASFGYALSKDKFRLTLADFNIHHDVSWVPPLPKQSREEYFRKMGEQARRLKVEKKMELGIIYADLVRVAYELRTEPFISVDLVNLAKNVGNWDQLDWNLAHYFASNGDTHSTQLCLKRYVEMKSVDSRNSAYLHAVTSLLLQEVKEIGALLKSFEQVIDSKKDGLSNLLHARLLCLAAEQIKPEDHHRQQYLQKAWELAQATISEGEGPGYEIEEWWSREFAPLADKLEPLIQQKRSALRYAVTWSPARGTDEQLCHGETIDLAMSQWQVWSQAGYMPHLISVVEWEGKPRVISAWRRARPLPEEEAAVAVRQAHMLLSLIQWGNLDLTWQALSDPSIENLPVTLANELIFRSHDVRVDAHLFARRLLEPCTPLLKYRLLLVLGQYSLAETGELQSKLLAFLTDSLLNDPDPGVHSASDWLLRQWKQEKLLLHAWKNKNVTLEERGNRLWYRGERETEYTIFEKPGVFFMGLSPDDMEVSVPYKERPHWRYIGHTFALAMKEVTKRDFLEFKPEHDPGDKRFSPSLDGPIGNVRWRDAALYCNELSRREGLKEDQWCYFIDANTNQVRTVPGYLRLRGYRLPLESEYEYACRGRTRLIRYFGNSPHNINKYAWFIENANRHYHQVGMLAPSPFGLFDLYGNATEWLHEVSGLYPAIYGTDIINDDARQQAAGVLPNSSNVMITRSLSWGADSYFIRTSQRSSRPANATSEAMDHGFRVARTVFE